ncbi:MAG TPA: helix-turn-helix transcriptional regulator [Burkholderiaceae bacterium]|nr:helix-turn-helix transcriptional regulator [Burkholderiaceae bacterium]
MPNFAFVLKAEIARIARREVRSAADPLRKAVVGHRSEIAALKRRIQGLEQQLRRLGRTGGEASAQPVSGETSSRRIRFTAKGLASQRRRLGLSAEKLGRMFGVSGQTIYLWEAGKARPRARHMPAIAALRTLGKKEAEAILAARPGARAGGAGRTR